MSEKLLHKKKISELKKYIVGFTRCNTLDGTLKSVPDIAIDFKQLKQCAIVIVKNCNETVDVAGFKGNKVIWCKCNEVLSEQRCISCKRFINFFELTEEDLK